MEEDTNRKRSASFHRPARDPGSLDNAACPKQLPPGIWLPQPWELLSSSQRALGSGNEPFPVDVRIQDEQRCCCGGDGVSRQPQPHLSPCPGLGALVQPWPPLPVHPCSQLCSWSAGDPPEPLLVQHRMCGAEPGCREQGELPDFPGLGVKSLLPRAAALENRKSHQKVRGERSAKHQDSPETPPAPAGAWRGGAGLRVQKVSGESHLQSLFHGELAAAERG